MPFVVLEKGYAHSHVAAPKNPQIKCVPFFFLLGQETRHKKTTTIVSRKVSTPQFLNDEAIADSKRWIRIHNFKLSYKVPLYFSIITFCFLQDLLS